MKLNKTGYNKTRHKRLYIYVFSILGFIFLLATAALFPPRELHADISLPEEMISKPTNQALAHASINSHQDLIEEEKISFTGTGTGEDLTPGAINSFIAFGDSITWGMMRMNNLPFDPSGQYHHRELAYPQKIKDMLAEEYPDITIDYFNLGVPRHTTYDGVERIDEELDLYSAKYLLIMMGTNDAWYKSFSLDQSIENLTYMIDAASKRDMNVVISTVPPRNDRFNIPRIAANIEALNEGIIKLAQEKNIKYIDTYNTFLNYDPPDGWKKLMEDRGKNYYVNGEAGEHPSPLGHRVIAELFVPEMLAFPPAVPAEITYTKLEGNAVDVRWQDNHEFDFSHYDILFGYFPDRVNRFVNAGSPHFTFIRPPFLTFSTPRIYLKIQAVDDRGNKSAFTPVYTAVFTAAL